MALRGIYNSVIACVRHKCSYSDYFACPGGGGGGGGGCKTRLPA